MRTPFRTGDIRSVILLGLWSAFAGIGAAGAEEAGGAPAEPDLRMEEIVSQVRRNEDLFGDLEVVLRKEKRLATPDNPKKWSVEKTSERLHIVWQDDLIYFQGEETQSRTSGETVQFTRVSAWDGEQTRSVEYGNSVNMHDGRFESQHVSPPHTWALFHQRVNFPLSVLLQGAEVIHQHPKVHRYPRERGSVYEFNKFEAEFAGEETIDGLRCLKIRCRRWYYSHDRPSLQYLWLAPERNYLCIKSEDRSAAVEDLPTRESAVNDLREVEPGLWLPARVTVRAYDYQALREGKRVVEWEDTLVLEEAKLNPDRPNAFFSEIETPADLPVFEIRDGQLAGTEFKDRDPDASSADRVQEFIEHLQAEERKYDRLAVELEKTYRHPQPGIESSSQFVLTTAKQTQEQSVQQSANAWFVSQNTQQGIDGSASSSEETLAFDGEWTRGLNTRTRTANGKATDSIYATLRRGGGQDVPVHRPHMLFYRDSWKYKLLSEHLASPRLNERLGYPHQVDYLGEEMRDGLRCAVVRDLFVPEGQDTVSNYRLLWLAVERNYLPVRYEWHEPPWNASLPTGIGLAKDLREIAPGVWYPFCIEILAFRKWDVTDLSVGRLLVNHRTDYTVREATLNPDIAADQFAGPSVPAGAKVYVRNEAGRSLGEYQQPETGPLAISREKYLELLNEANEREREAKQRQAALDALIGTAAPAFPESKWLNSAPLSWDELSGKVVIVSFWSEWCGPCKPDLERLADLHRLWAGVKKEDAVILGVHTAGSDLSDIEETVEKYKLEYPVLVDTPPQGDSGWGTLYNRFAVHAIPHVFVVDAQGKIAAHGRLEEMLSKAAQLSRGRSSESSGSTDRDRSESEESGAGTASDGTGDSRN